MPLRSYVTSKLWNQMFLDSTLIRSRGGSLIWLRIKLKAEWSSKFHSRSPENLNTSHENFLLRPSSSLAPRSASNLLSSFEAKHLSNTQLGKKVHKMCTGGWIWNWNFNSQFFPPPTPSSEIDAPSISIALSGLLIRHTGRERVAASVVICCFQYFPGLGIIMMVALPGVFWGDLLRSYVQDMMEWPKG